MDKLKTFQLRGKSQDTDENPIMEKMEPEQSSPSSPRKSKRYIFRIFRLGASIAMTLTSLILILIVLLNGRYGNGNSDLALITVNMTNFARFTPPTIVLTNATTNSTNTTATKTRRSIKLDGRGLGGDITSALGSAETYAAGKASAVASDLRSGASAVETAIGAAATAAETEADKVVDAIGDELSDIEEAVEGLMDKVLDTIQDDLNAWLQDAADELNKISIPNQVSLHLTTHCSSGDRNVTNSTKTNNGTIFGFQPSSFLERALGVFFVPATAQEEISAPVYNASNDISKLMAEAKSEISSWTVNLLFIPIVVIYVLAAVFTTLLLLILIATTALAVKGEDSVPAKIYAVCGKIALVATGFVFLGSVVLTVVFLICHILNLAGGVVGIAIQSGDRLKWLSWAATAIMLFVTATFKIEEWVADVVFWFAFLGKLLRIGRNKEGLAEALRDMK